MTVKLLTEHHLAFLSLNGGCTGSSESTLVKMPHCWKSPITAQMYTRKAMKELLAIRRIFSLVDMITNTKFSNCPNVSKIGVVQQ